MTKNKIAIIAAIMLAALLPCLVPAAVPSEMPFTPSSWVPVATIVVLTIIIIAGFVYALSGIIMSQNARNWARMQIYEALLSLLLIAIFGTFSYIFFTNPQVAFGALNLVPQKNAAIDCTTATSIFTLATCDLSLFNRASFQLANIGFLFTYVISLIPRFSITINPLPMVQGLSFGFGPIDLIPLVDMNLLTFGYMALLGILLLQQVELILLSSAILFLSLFMTLGLVARTFGFTRSFGGAMIAFGLGLGMIYPLLVCITYGYIDVHAGVGCMVTINPSSGCAGAGALTTSAAIAILFSILAQTFGASPTAAASGFFLQISYLVAGMTFIPFLNFIILSAFISDFSAAIGERMDFMSLFTGLI